jgi:hypothetical protein
LSNIQEFLQVSRSGATIKILLETASAFYSELKTRFGKTDLSWQELREILSAEKPPAKFKLK